jgi:hypothetical protein
MEEDMITLEGKDNRGNPRQNFANDIAELNDDEFVKKAETYIWLSAYANNNPRSDYHWQADACHDEAAARLKPELYRQAYDNAVRTL